MFHRKLHFKSIEISILVSNCAPEHPEGHPGADRGGVRADAAAPGGADGGAEGRIGRGVEGEGNEHHDHSVRAENKQTLVTKPHSQIHVMYESSAIPDQSVM